MVLGQRRTAHRMGNRQLPTRFYQSSQYANQPFRIREMGKSIVHHDAIELTVKLYFLHITADHLHLRKFGCSDFDHLRRKINGSNGGSAPLQIVREQNSGAAGHIQHIHTGLNSGIVQYLCNNRLVAVMLMLPLIFVGVVAGLGITGKMFDFFSLLGLLGLVGMNVKNAVILISRIRELRDDGYAPAYAVIEAARDRFIPVVAASGTTVLGMLPLLFDSMFGSMAATIMGGLVVATLLVLVVLPIVYSLLYRIRL